MTLADQWRIRCGACGHEDTVEAWSTTPIGGRLSADTVQCPACGVAVRKRSPREQKRDALGTYYPDHPDAVGGDPASRLVRVPTAL